MTSGEQYLGLINFPPTPFDRAYAELLDKFKAQPVPRCTPREEKLIRRGLRRLREKAQITFLQRKYDEVLGE
jgi:hypothetical protein